MKQSTTCGKNREKFSREFVELLDYINAPAEEAEKYTVTEPVRRLHEGILRLKKKERTMVRYMQRWEQKQKDREEGREEGERIGEARGLKIGETRGILTGKAVQIVEMGQEVGLSVNEILVRLQEKLDISPGEAKEYYIKYGKAGMFIDD